MAGPNPHVFSTDVRVQMTWVPFGLSESPDSPVGFL